VLNDTASLSGGSAPTGSVTFNLFAPTDQSCTGTPAYTNTDPTAPYATSPGFTSNAVGVWHWTAHYAGDSDNNSADSACSAEAVTVTAPPITRTLGFWQTHFTFTNSVYASSGGSSNPIWTFCGTRIVTDITSSNMSMLYGGFYASIPKTTIGTKRSALDQARMQLMQQLLAAILNNIAFGGGTSLIAPAKSAYCGTSVSDILNQVTILDNFNGSGDSLSTSQNTGSAEPKTSSADANLVAWDVLP
ncbi:MAG TPA: hypothetical protein VLF90_04425, partial [Patescibacteria group bacterium]|nr:hypothetical protein [Patescibacteria group bacterium]